MNWIAKWTFLNLKKLHMMTAVQMKIHAVCSHFIQVPKCVKKMDEKFYIDELHLVSVQNLHIQHISFCSQQHQDVC